MSFPTCWDPKGLAERLNSQSVYAPDQLTRDAIANLVGILSLHRPTKSNGKHGDLHTPTCGCDREAGNPYAREVNTDAESAPASPEPLTAEDFGNAHHGVHLFPFEDDWGWYAYGHHEARRIAAACVASARADGVFADLREGVTLAEIYEGASRKWAVRGQSVPGCTYMRWVDEGTPGAVPVTVVTL